MKRLSGILLALILLAGTLCFAPAAMASTGTPSLEITFDAWMPTPYPYYCPGGTGTSRYSITDEIFYFPDDGILPIYLFNTTSRVRIFVNNVDAGGIDAPGSGATSLPYVLDLEGECCVTLESIVRNVQGNYYEVKLKVTEGGIDEIIVVTNPVQYNAGACPADFAASITTKSGTDSLSADNLIAACYYINEVEFPITFGVEATRESLSDGSAVIIKPTQTGLDMMNALSAGKYQIWLEYDPAKAITAGGKKYYMMDHTSVDFTVISSSGSVPSTGDSTPVAACAVLAVCALLCGAAVLVRKKRGA